MTSSSPPNHTASLEALSYAELLARRADIVSRAQNRPSNLADNELEELVQIVALLRRRQSGPPAARPARTPKTPDALESLI